MRKNVKKLVFASAFAAFTCVATLLIQITLPGGGYFNLGDCVVIVSGVVLGPLFGFFSAAIGSMIADLFGFALYAPATFIVKGLMALIVALFYKKTSKIYFVALSAFLAEAVMVFGYFLYELILTQSFETAFLGIVGNLMQGFVGIVSSVSLIVLITKNKAIKKLLFE